MAVDFDVSVFCGYPSHLSVAAPPGGKGKILVGRWNPETTGLEAGRSRDGHEQGWKGHRGRSASLTDDALYYPTLALTLTLT